MKDPFFERTLVLLWHHDEEGAVGVVVNRPVEDHTLDDVLTIEGVDLVDYPDGHISWGGPVETDSGTVVTTGEVSGDDVWLVGHGITVTRSNDALTELLKQRAALVLCLGYAGWGPGQLDEEIETGGWLFADIDPELILGGDRETAYERALASLGLTPTTIWMQPIDA